MFILFILFFEDGQAQAKRLSKSVTKESGNLKKPLKKYNSSVEILRQNGYINFTILNWEEASDVNSTIYSLNIPNEDQIPVAVKRAAVDALCLTERSTEEIQLLDQEMANCIQVFFDRCNNTEAFLNVLQDKEDFGNCDLLKGLYSTHKRILDDERFNLFVACNLYCDDIAVSQDVRNYVDQHFIHVSKILEINNDALEEESDEDEDVEERELGREM